MSFFQNFSVILLFLTIFQICTQLKVDDEGNYTFLITGGYRPQKHTFAKHIVSIRTRTPKKFFGDNHMCGGAILSSRVILTAAHCVHDPTFGGTHAAFNFRVVAGTPNRLKAVSETQIIDVDYIVLHPDYTSELLRNDIAIMHLKDDIVLDGVRAQEIPITNVPPQVGNFCTVVGWGRMFDEGPLADDAMYVNVQKFDDKDCATEPWFSAPEMICAGDPTDVNKDSCTGDSGGPMICNDMVAGIVSFGRECASGEPGFYTNVWNYRKWIRENNGCSICVHFGIILLTIIFWMAAINCKNF